MGQGKSTPQPTPTPPVQTRNVRQAWGKYLTSEEEISKKTPQDMAKDERFRITELPEDAQERPVALGRLRRRDTLGGCACPKLFSLPESGGCFRR